MRIVGGPAIAVLLLLTHAGGTAAEDLNPISRVAELYVIGVNAGDEKLMLECFADDLKVYNNSIPPRFGAAEHAAYWARMHDEWRARFTIDRLVTSDNEAVMEWSALLYPPGGTTEQLIRGVDWLLFEKGKIVEIHEYGDPRLGPEPPPLSGALVGFPYQERGYPTTRTLDSMLLER